MGDTRYKMSYSNDDFNKFLNANTEDVDRLLNKKRDKF